MDTILIYITILSIIITLRSIYLRFDIFLERLLKISTVRAKWCKMTQAEYYGFRLSALWLIVYYKEPIIEWCKQCLR